MKRFKLIHIINSLEIGGAQRLLADLLPAFNTKVNVTLLVCYDVNNDFKQQIQSSGVNIICLNYDNIKSPILIYRFRQIIKDFDIVHVHLFPQLYWVGLASVGLKCKLVYTEHNTTNRRRSKCILRPIETYIYSLYKRIICISKSTELELCKWIKAECDDNRFITIENGINLSRFRIKRTKQIYPFTLIMVARFAPAKDQNTIIRVMPHLNKDIHLVLVGDGDSLSQSKELAYSLMVDDRVHFLGKRDDVPEIIANSDVGIQSSLWEGFGLTAVEIMASGKPVIATNVEGLRQIVEGAGLLFEVADQKCLQNLINKLYLDKNYYSEVSKKCLQRAEKYDIKEMVDGYLNVYNEILNE